MKKKNKILYDKLLCLEEIKWLRKKLKDSSYRVMLLDKMGITFANLEKAILFQINWCLDILENNIKRELGSIIPEDIKED